MRYRLRTLLIVLALGPPVLAFCYAAIVDVGPSEALAGAAIMAAMTAAGAGLVAANARA
jgi:hypothetical protein